MRVHHRAGCSCSVHRYVHASAHRPELSFQEEGNEAVWVHQSAVMFPGSCAPVHSADFSDVFSSEDHIN